MGASLGYHRDVDTETQRGAEMIRAFLARGQAERERAVEARVASLRARLSDVVGCLRARGARRVWLFGSLAWGGAHERSDLDVAVEGVPPAELDRAHAELWELLGEPVDLVPIESAAASLAQQIRERGEVLL